MRIAKLDYELGHPGRVHQAVLDAVPEEEAIDVRELKKTYDGVKDQSKPPLDQVIHNLEPYLEFKFINSTTYYRRRHRWLISKEAADRLGVSLRTVQAWYKQGLLKAKKIGGRLRFATKDVEDLASGKGDTIIQGSEDPVLTELWDNDADAAYDKL